MDTTGMMNLSWADIITRGEGHRERPDRNKERPRLRTKPLPEEQQPKPIHLQAPVGSVVDLYGLCLHLGCGPRDAILRARHWPTWIERKRKGNKSGITLDIQVWEVVG